MTKPVAIASATQVATVDRHQWATLKNSLYPGARDDSIRMVLSYCKARGLDPMKKPCHIVPMKVGNEWRDVVFPGIYELRTTAQKTGDYMGQDEPEFGPDMEYLGQTVPQYCKVVVHRFHEKSGERVSFPATARFEEYCGTRRDKETGSDVLNQRWAKAPYQMLEKCAEAAALRKAFPDELGGEMSAEEMEGVSVAPAPAMKPETQAPEPTGETIEGEALCTDKQAKLIRTKLDQAGLPENDFLAKFDIASFEELRFDQVNEALAYIRDVAP